MTENKLPEGVGKKIVEALKKQSEIEVQPMQEEVAEPEIENLISDEVENMFVEEDNTQYQQPEDFAPQAQPVKPMPARQYTQEPVYREPIQTHYEQDIPYVMQQQYREVAPMPSYDYSDSLNSEPQSSYPRPKEFTIPANVAVLKRLIAQLPQGVSKQTGAQIIRQTMEALGISMSTVLTEAQNFQDGLNTSVRDCVSTIQDYKNNIKNLEKQVSDYQKQSAQVNDLISLFIMTDK